jgi:very-short-patch-repair endonuclease
MLKYTETLSSCLECGINIDDKVLSYSTKHFRHPLCRKHQDWLRDIHEHSTATEESINLYFALKQREVPAQFEKDDGFKTIDIAVPHAKVNIEVDGRHHNYSAKQALSDLKRTLYSFKKGYTTLRIPNSLVKDDLEETAELITRYLIVSRDSKKKGY